MTILDLLTGNDNHLREHRVQPGDTLATLSQHYYGTPKHALVIYSHNQDVMGTDPNHMVWGSVLVIPHIPNCHG